MNPTAFKHQVFYFKVAAEHLIGVIPTLDLAFKLASLDNFLPGYVWNDIHPLFYDGFKRKLRVKRVLVLTLDCNLNCSYCFEGKSKTNASMSDECVENIIAKQFEEAKKFNKQLISFSLFGGEPTLQWSGVRTAINTAQKYEKIYGIKCIKAIVTNGLMNEKKANYLSNSFDYIYMSLDGPKELFNLQRKSRNINAYDKIFGNAQTIYNSKAKLNFKVTITSHTVDRMKEIDDFFAFHFPTCGRLYQPCMIERKSHLFVNFEDFIEKFFYLKSYSCFPETLAMSLYKAYPSDRFCNLQIRNVIYPDNLVLACHRSNLCIPNDLVKSNFFVGTCDHGLINRNPEQDRHLMQFSLNSLQECSDCFARFYCCGGCPAIKLFYNQNIKEKASYCDQIKNYLISTLLTSLGETASNFVTQFQKLQPSNTDMEYHHFLEKYTTRTIKLS